jgi:hypothetical protein
MATKKQRRRQEKDRRHEWEYVYVDDDGREVEVEEAGETAPPKPARGSGQAKPRSAGKPGSKGRQQTGRAGRKVDPPSWRRVVRRGGIFAPVMLVVIYLLRPKGASAVSLVVQLVVLLLFFLPFSYMMDSMMYRAYRKRIGDPIPPRERKSRQK